MENFIDCTDFYKLKTESQISHDKKIIANPFRFPFSNWQHIIDNDKNLYDYCHLINDVYNEVKPSDCYSSILTIQNIKKRIDYTDRRGYTSSDCETGEIEVECLIRFHDSLTYDGFDDCVFRESNNYPQINKLSIGYIVALRFLNLP